MVLILLFLILNTLSIASPSSYCNKVTDGVCTECINNYFLDDSHQCISRLDFHCGVSSTYSQCEKCSPGYKFDFSNYTCVIGDELCASIEFYNKVATCTECPKGYTIVNETECYDCSFFGNSLCKSATKDCSVCTECVSGSYILDGKCIKISNCEVAKEDGMCEYCITGYYIDKESGTCKLGKIPLCIDYESQFECSECSGNSFNNITECIKIDNCHESDEDDGGICTKCNNGYGMDGILKCSKCTVENCKNCDMNTSICQRCNDGLAKLAEDKCGDCSQVHGCKE
ncbi:hypothetical protein EIN_009790, partial [Entamoeba invadens IP1]